MVTPLRLTLTATPMGKSRPDTSSKSEGWVIRFEGANINEVQHLRFNQLNVEGGRADLSGTIQFQIRGQTEISQVRANWKDTNIELNGKGFKDRVNVHFDGNIKSFYPRQDKGLALLQKLSGNIVINGTVGTLTPLQWLLPEIKWIEHIDGEGQVDIDMDIELGKLQPGSIIDVDATDLKLAFLGYTAKGNGRVDGTVTQNASSQVGQVKLQFDQFALTHGENAEPMVSGQGLSLVVNAPDLGVTDGIEDIETILDIPSSQYPDISVLDDHLPDSLGIHIDGGRALLAAHLMVSGVNGNAQGVVELEGKELKGRFRNMDFMIDMQLDSKLSGANVDDFKVDIDDTELRLLNGVFDNSAVNVDKDWWMTIAVPNGQVDLRQPASVTAEVDLSMKDTRAIIALFAEIKEWVSRFDGFLTVRDVVGTGTVFAAKQHLDITDLDIQGDKLKLNTELSARQGQHHALVWGKLGIISLGLERIDDENDWKLIKSRSWYEQKKAELSD